MMKKLLIGLALLTGASVSQAAVFNYDDFSDLSDWQINGDAIGLNPNADNNLRLTESAGFQGGSAFLSNAITLNAESSFQAFFKFQIANSAGASDIDGIGADGLVFVVQTNDNSVGGVGGGIGYLGIENSVGIEFDTWNNGALLDADSGNHVGINIDGSIASSALVTESVRFNDADIWSVWVDYNGANDLLEVRWSMDGLRVDDALLSLEVDLTAVLDSNEAFFGFTSGTGGAYGRHDILSARFVDDFVAQPVNAPTVLFLTMFGIAGLFANRRIKV
jgi:hypothetical protein